MSSFVVQSWETFVGIALETDGNSPYGTNAGNFTGFNGTSPNFSAFGAASPTIFLPLAGDESMVSIPNYVDLNTADGTKYLMKYQSIANHAEGSLPLYCSPGSFTFLKQWIFDRLTVTGATNQVRSATVWVQVGGVCRRVVGVKVNTAEFNITKGQAMNLNLGCYGYGEHIVSNISFSAPSWWYDAVYAGDTVTVQVDGSEHTQMDTVRWTINNLLDDDPHRLWSSNYPRQLLTRGREVTGGFDADFQGSAEYDKFLRGASATLNVALAKTVGSGSYTATFAFPKLRYDNLSGANATNEKQRLIKESVDFRALSPNVSTDEMSWS